jgi:PRC-barrel domain/Domain of unknown function (DUF2382)
MTERDLDTLLGWRGRAVLARDGETLGKLGDLYLDEATDRPAYGGVRTGLFGRHESIVPLEGMVERGDDLVVPHDAERVRSAPAIDPGAALAEDEQERLARHYGVEMIRSEEEVVTGTTEMRPAERVRLRKVLVTDHVEKTVPVRREEIRLETDPPPEGTIERVEDVE